MAEIIQATFRKVNELAELANPDEISLIPTTRNLCAIVDRKFAAQVCLYRWYAHIPHSENIYAVADIGPGRASLQRLVMSLANPGTTVEDFKHVSFKNKFGFDCRLENLLKKDGRQSVMRNRKPKRNTSSQFKGVMKKVRSGGQIYWRGQICGSFGSMSLGSFEDEERAAVAYDAASHLMFEGSGYLNFPERPPDPDALEDVRWRITRFHMMQAKKLAKKNEG